MLTFKQFRLREMKLSRIAQALDKHEPVGVVSPEQGGMNAGARKAAHHQMKNQLKDYARKGLISFSGKNSGQYKYDAEAKPAVEKSYIVRPGRNADAKGHFHKILTSLGAKHGQESVMKLVKIGKDSPGGYYHYTKDTEHHKKGDVEYQGKIKYNKPLTVGGGNTKLKGSEQTFTTVKPDKKNG